MKKHLLNKVIASSIIALGITSCNEGASNNLPKNQAIQSTQTSAQTDKYNLKNQIKLANEMLQNNNEPLTHLGDGYDSRTGYSTGINCLANADDINNIELSNPSGMIDFKNTVSIEKVSEYLHTGGGVGGIFAFFSASERSEYVKNSSDTRQSINFNYLQTVSMDAKYKIPSPGATTKILNPDIKTLLDDDMDSFTNVCGDSFLMSGKMGAVLLVDAQLNFRNAASKEEFKSKVGSNFIFARAKASFEKISSSSQTDASISIKVLQLGGDPTKLANIFGDKQQGGYHILQCGINNIDSCDKVAAQIISYAQTDFQAGIDLKNPKTLWTYDFYNKPWSKLAIKATLPDLTPQTQAAITYLNDTLAQDKTMYDYLQNYQRQPFWQNVVVQVDKDNIIAITNDYKKMLDNYINAHVLEACYGSGADINKLCPIAADNVKQMRTKYKASIDSANQFSNTILIQGSPSLQLAFIPVKTSAGCTRKECWGWWIGYNYYTNSYLNKSSVIDTTKTNSYFNKGGITNPDKSSLIGKSAFIYNINNIDNVYIKRIADKDQSMYGITGHLVNGKDIDYTPSFAQMYYSGNDFKYNPI